MGRTFSKQCPAGTRLRLESPKKVGTAAEPIVWEHHVDAERLARITGAIDPGADLDSATYPQRVCSAAVDLLELDSAGLTLMTKSQLGAVWASDNLAATVEDLQFALGEGPALDAYGLGAPSLEPSLESDSARWPFFSPQAVGLGVKAVFSFPLRIGVIRLGALNLFRGEPGLLTKDQLADALVLADVTTQDIIDLQAQGSLHWPLSDRFAERARVHQATGMIAAQIDSDMANALARIRGYAFAKEISIFSVAEEVIARRLRLTAQPLE